MPARDKEYKQFQPINTETLLIPRVIVVGFASNLVSEKKPQMYTTRRKPFASPFSRMTVLTVMGVIPMFAQIQQPRPTLAQAQEILKRHPELQIGIRSPKNGVIQVTEAISGGFVLRFQDQRGLTTGQVTVTGPTIMFSEGGIWGILGDVLVDLGKGVLDAVLGSLGGGGGGAGGTPPSTPPANNNQGCTNVNVTVHGNAGNITVNGNSCTRPQ